MNFYNYALKYISKFAMPICTYNFICLLILPLTICVSALGYSKCIYPILFGLSIDLILFIILYFFYLKLKKP